MGFRHIINPPKELKTTLKRLLDILKYIYKKTEISLKYIEDIIEILEIKKNKLNKLEQFQYYIENQTI